MPRNTAVRVAPKNKCETRELRKRRVASASRRDETEDTPKPTPTTWSTPKTLAVMAVLVGGCLLLVTAFGGCS